MIIHTQLTHKKSLMTVTNLNSSSKMMIKASILSDASAPD